MVTIINKNSGFDTRQIYFGSMVDEYQHSYSSTLIRAYEDNGWVDDFEGHGFKFEQGHTPQTATIQYPVAGTLTSFTEHAQGSFVFKLGDLNIDITNMVPAAKSLSSHDDHKLFAQLMDGQDTYEGGNAYSYVNTFGGRDILIGRGGADVLLGGTGADTFIYKKISDSTHNNYDSLMDFSRDDHDKIDLSAIDANGEAKGDAAFNFIGTHELSHHAGELHVSYDKHNTYVGGDKDGDGKDDLLIALNGNLHLTQHSFEL